MMDCVSKRSIANLIDEVWQAYGVDTIDRFRDELLERLEAMPTMEGNMSAYGDYKCGAITYREYGKIIADEERMDEPKTCENCVHREDECRNTASPFYGQEVDIDDSCEDWYGLR